MMIDGPRAMFPSGVFSTREKAEEWISRHDLKGTLTEYPIDISVYDWAISNDLFTPKRDDQKSAEFIARFSSASQEHEHYNPGDEE